MQNATFNVEASKRKRRAAGISQKNMIPYIKEKRTKKRKLNENIYRVH